MDYSHSPMLVVLVGTIGALMGVLVVVMGFLAFRRPRPPAASSDDRADAPPPRRRGSGPGAPDGGDGGDLG